MRTTSMAALALLVLALLAPVPAKIASSPGVTVIKTTDDPDTGCDPIWDQWCPYTCDPYGCY